MNILDEVECAIELANIKGLGLKPGARTHTEAGTEIVGLNHGAVILGCGFMLIVEFNYYGMSAVARVGVNSSEVYVDGIGASRECVPKVLSMVEGLL